MFSASYDSSSSIPTPDMSSNIYAIGGNDTQPNNPSMKVVPAHPPAAYLYSSTDDPFTSPAAIKVQIRTMSLLVCSPILALMGTYRVLDDNFVLSIYSIIIINFSCSAPYK